MAEIEATTRKWGNSLGIAIPRDVVEQERLRENQRVVIDIRQAGDLKRLRGLVKFKKTAQQMKDEMRAGWK